MTLIATADAVCKRPPSTFYCTVEGIQLKDKKIKSIKTVQHLLGTNKASQEPWLLLKLLGLQQESGILRRLRMKKRSFGSLVLCRLGVYDLVLTLEQ